MIKRRPALPVVVFLAVVAFYAAGCADTSEIRKERLMEAARDGDLERAELLLKEGVDADAKDNDGKTALDYSLERFLNLETRYAKAGNAEALLEQAQKEVPRSKNHPRRGDEERQLKHARRPRAA